MNKLKPRWFSVLLLPIIFLSLLSAGCQPTLEPEGPLNIRIAFDNEMTFNREYRDHFDAAFPTWNITIVPMNQLKIHEMKEPEATQAFVDFIQREKPDLIIMFGMLYKSLANSGALLDLGEWMARDGMDPNTLAPGVVDILKDNNDGKFYGLSPTFRTSVLYYNKTMFRSYGIEEPHDQMTWKEVLALANRFMQDGRMEKGTYGFHEDWVRTPMDMLDMIGSTEGLHYIDLRKTKITLQSDEWTKVWNIVSDSFKQGAFSTLESKLKVVDGETYVTEEAQKQMDLFSQGKAAMTYAQDDLMLRLKSSAPDFEWGVFSGPVSSRDPEKVGWFATDITFVIPTVSSQPKAAWKAVQYFHSDRMGKIRVSLDQGLYSLKEYPKWSNDPNYEMFYKQRGWPSTDNYMTSIVPTVFFKPFNDLVNEQMNATIAGEKTAEQALSFLQAEGQAMLNQMMAAK
ncbi:ABC transporter substrate-binding protein [Cohnella sp.]|uniref:ABC transporter substrate-binding protein n=1 Tax=Cohnella sp. TaxID=1883426 RepID=UPI003564C1BF